MAVYLNDSQTVGSAINSTLGNQSFMPRTALDIKLKMTEELALEYLTQVAAGQLSHKLIPFPDVFSRICPALSIKKAEAWHVLRLLQQKGNVKILPFRGVRIIAGEIQ